MRQLGTDKVEFTIGSEGTPWLERSYKNLTSAGEQVPRVVGAARGACPEPQGRRSHND